MKKCTNIIILVTLAFFLSACSEKILDKVPLERFSDAVVWVDPNLASAYLNSCYSSIGNTFGFEGSMVAGEMFFGRGAEVNNYLSGNMTSDNVNGAPYRWGAFSNVQKINSFLDNIDKVSDSYEEPKKTNVKAKTDVMKGEALFLRAWIYTSICCSHGGVPLFAKANKLGDDFLGITRATFKETVDFIVKDCDDAAKMLQLKSQMEMGRATKEAALALKSRILLFAASDLTADGTAENDLVGYKTPNRTALWTAARDAAKAVMDLRTCELANFGAPNQNVVAQNYFEFFKADNLSNKEVIWGKMFLLDIGDRQRINRSLGPNGNGGFSRNGPLQSMVDEYEMNDGSKFFDHFNIINDNYIKKSAKFSHENPYYNREPRFYANVLYDSAVWQPRSANLVSRDPLGIFDRRTRVKKQGGVEISKTFGIDTRQGPVDPKNGCYTGYLTKKFQDNTVNTRSDYNKNIWIYIRYAEIILNYAEACLALGDIPTATANINLIRNRVGLPNFKGDITQALRHERKVELYGEETGWYDIRRWKILEERLSPLNYGIDILEINDGGKITTTWKRIEAQPANNPNKKMYWIPILTTELKKAPQLVQNPGF